MSFEGRYHIVTVNSAEMLVQMGFDSRTERVYELIGVYNQAAAPPKVVPTKHNWITRKLNIEDRYRFHFKTEPVWNKARALDELLAEAREDGAIDITIIKMGALLKYETTVKYHEVPYPLENITKREFRRWAINPSAFEKRGTDPPEVRIYQEFKKVLRKLADSLPKETVIRRRASIIVNKADDVLNLDDLRKLLRFRPWALVLERREEGSV